MFRTCSTSSNGPTVRPIQRGALSGQRRPGIPRRFICNLGIGNEDKIKPGFKERFTMIFDAVRAKHPEITVIGTVGPAPAGADFDEGWKLADELRVPIVDEHYDMGPDWFWKNRGRYDLLAK